jgi:hypothetical protein
MRAILLILLVPVLRADDQTQKMTARVSEEAEAFAKLAPEVLGTETLHQKAQKPPARFHPRVGDAAKGPPAPSFRERTVVSEYGFTSFSNEPGALHELRQVVSVAGRKVEDSKKAQDSLAKVIMASDDGRKKEVLKQFEKVGLLGAVTDFGQLILLFARRELERYEFAVKGPDTLENAPVLVFTYKQLDGPEGLTLIQANKKDQLHRLRMQGEIWVNPESYVPMRITMVAMEGVENAPLHEEASVDYAMSKFGALLPVSTTHRELRAGKVIAENHFSYSDFRKFGASSDIKFEVAP